MKSSIVKNIASVLNCPSSLRDKQRALQELVCQHRGENRTLLNIINHMFDTYVLPIRIYDKINSNQLQIKSHTLYSKLKDILDNSSCDYFNAICGELLWSHYHNINLASKSINAYMSELNRTDSADDSVYTQLSISICRIYSKCPNVEFEFSAFLKQSLEYINSNYHKENFCILFILNALAKCKKNDTAIIKAFREAIEYYERAENYLKAISFLEDLAKYIIPKKNEKAIKEIHIQIARNYENAANKLNWEDCNASLRIINLIHNAMKAWNDANTSESKSERHRLAKRIEPIKKASLNAFHPMQYAPENTDELNFELESIINNSSLEQIIYTLSLAPNLISTNDLIEQHNHTFFDMIKTSIVDADGRKVVILPPLSNATENEKLAYYEFQASKQYIIFAQTYIKQFIFLLNKKYELNEDDLRFLVDNNAFIQEDRKHSFLKGIVAGFQADFVTAVHLLLPQIEHCFRCLASGCGAVVFTTDDNGVEKCLSLENVLRTTEIIDSLDDTFLFNLRLFYTSIYGFGMRNMVSHGLYSDRALQSPHGIAVWWFSLRICCMFSPELYLRIAQQNQNE